MTEDPIVAEVIQRMKDRSIAGMKKFGVPMTRPDVTTEEWIDNTIEELLDAAVYLTRVKSDLRLASRATIYFLDGHETTVRELLDARKS